MKKEDAIKRFKDACNNRLNNDPIGMDGKSFRQSAVETQFNRNVWQLTDEDGMIRITHHARSTPDITIFHSAEYAKKNNTPATFTSPLLPTEYSELQALFFGNYKPDAEYLKKLKSLSA